jgi:hypothetical protein
MVYEPAFTPESGKLAVAAPPVTVPDVTVPIVAPPFLTVNVTVPTFTVLGLTVADSTTEGAPKVAEALDPAVVVEALPAT